MIDGGRRGGSVSLKVTWRENKAREDSIHVSQVQNWQSEECTQLPSQVSFDLQIKWSTQHVIREHLQMPITSMRTKDAHFNSSSSVGWFTLELYPM